MAEHSQLGFARAKESKNILDAQSPALNPHGVKAPMTVETLTEALHDHLVWRRMEQGKKLISDQESLLRIIEADHPGAPRLLYILGGWTEYSRLAAETVGRLDKAYAEGTWPQFSFEAWGWIMAGKASLAVYENRHEDVHRAWRWVQENANRFNASLELQATVDLAVTRSTKRQADYKVALDLAQKAVAGYEAAGLPCMAAVAKTTEGWLRMQLGNLGAATRLWKEAYSCLEGTEDWTSLGNIRFAVARCLCREDKEEEALKAFKQACDSHSRYNPHPRTLRRVLIEWANLELRMAARMKDHGRATQLKQDSAKRIAQVRELMKGDPKDFRNDLRLRLAEANQALRGIKPSLIRARSLAADAYKAAEERNDILMMARAARKKASIDYRTVTNGSVPCIDPVRTLIRAAQHSTEALALSETVHNDRLQARIHTLRGKIFLEFPFRDTEEAKVECDAARKCLSHHQDSDYVVKEIDSLRHKIEAAEQKQQ